MRSEKKIIVQDKLWIEPPILEDDYNFNHVENRFNFKRF